METDQSKSRVGLFLHFVSGVPPSKLSYKFYVINKMKDSDPGQFDFMSIRSENDWITMKTSQPEGRGWGYSNFIPHKDLLKNSELFITDRKIRTVATIFVQDDKPVMNVGTSKMSEGLKKLYESKKHADLTIKGSGTGEIKAHKSILVARSEVFDRMLSHDMDEKESGIIHIKDLSIDVIKGLLHYIYCEDRYGEIPKLAQIDINLYHAAEKYQLDELKTICLKSIYARLDIRNALEVLSFAKLFNLQELHSCCLLLIYA